MLDKKQRHTRRIKRSRARIDTMQKRRPRLSVCRSNQHISAQIIIDGKVQACASTMEKAFKDAGTSNKEAAHKIGTLIAQRAIENSIKQVAFDRSGHIYHGRVKALAEGAREAGLEF